MVEWGYVAVGAAVVGIGAYALLTKKGEKKDEKVEMLPDGKPFQITGGPRPHHVWFPSEKWEPLTPILHEWKYAIRGTAENGTDFRPRGAFVPGNVGAGEYGLPMWELTDQYESRFVNLEDQRDFHWGCFFNRQLDFPVPVSDNLHVQFKYTVSKLNSQNAERFCIGFVAKDVEGVTYYMEVNLDRTDGYDLFRGNPRIDRKTPNRDILYWNGPELKKTGDIVLEEPDPFVIGGGSRTHDTDFRANVSDLFRMNGDWKNGPADKLKVTGVYFGTEVRGKGRIIFRPSELSLYTRDRDILRVLT